MLGLTARPGIGSVSAAIGIGLAAAFAIAQLARSLARGRHTRSMVLHGPWSGSVVLQHAPWMDWPKQHCIAPSKNDERLEPSVEEGAESVR